MESGFCSPQATAREPAVLCHCVPWTAHGVPALHDTRQRPDEPKRGSDSSPPAGKTPPSRPSCKHLAQCLRPGGDPRDGEAGPLRGKAGPEGQAQAWTRRQVPPPGSALTNHRKPQTPEGPYLSLSGSCVSAPEEVILSTEAEPGGKQHRMALNGKLRHGPCRRVHLSTRGSEGAGAQAAARGQGFLPASWALQGLGDQTSLVSISGPRGVCRLGVLRAAEPRSLVGSSSRS